MHELGLKEIEDGFELNLQWNRPRPQIIDGAIILNIEIVKTFCERELKGDVKGNLIIDKCEVLNVYHSDLNQNHERWLMK